MFDVVLKGPHNERVWAAVGRSGGVECLSLFHVTAKANEQDTDLLLLHGREPHAALVGWLDRRLPGQSIVAG